ncbi:MAG: BON domain-containing protein [Pirellulales bacterium]|nr:BON domain-containing protein [Pirellulales bacterium]
MLHKRFESDKTILKKINQRLSRTSIGSQSQITATVRNGQVTLSGSIQYENQRRPAMRAANGVEGVSRIVDQIKLKSRDVHRKYPCGGKK